MTKLTSFQGKYKIKDTIIGIKADRHFDFQLMTNSSGVGRDIPAGKFAKAMEDLNKDILDKSNFTGLCLISGKITVNTSTIDDKHPDNDSQNIEITGLKSLEYLRDLMLKFKIPSVASAPQSEVMEDIKQPFLPSNPQQHSRRKDDSDADECCSSVRSVLRCLG